MGKALDWLGHDGCAQVAGQILRDPEQRGGEVWAWCPWHEEKDKGAFSYSPTRDVGYCNGCGQSGDIIAIFGATHGYDASAAFVEFRQRYAAHVPNTRRPAVLTPRMPQALAAPIIEAKPVTLPPQQWMDRAEAIVMASHAALLDSSAHMAWLAARGITRPTVVRYRLGWNDRDYLRPYPAWGLPPAKWDDGNERLHKVPRGLVIPWIDGGHVLRLRVRQPDKDPKYYVVPGGATDPQPLMVLDSTWPGQHTAVILVEAELDALLLAQEVGDIVTVIALGSATTRPHDPRSFAVVSKAAWVGLWLDRDHAGDDAVRTWTISTHRDGQPADGGLGAAMGTDAEDIRPQGLGKLDPGDAFAQGLDIRAHILGMVPAAWRAGARGPLVHGASFEGAGDALSEGAGSAPAESVVALSRLLRQAPIVCRYSDGLISIAAYKRAEGKWLVNAEGAMIQDTDWEMAQWDIMREASRLFWHDAAVQDFLEQHPDAAVGISGRNYWAAMAKGKK